MKNEKSRIKFTFQGHGVMVGDLSVYCCQVGACRMTVQPACRDCGRGLVGPYGLVLLLLVLLLLLLVVVVVVVVVVGSPAFVGVFSLCLVGARG